MHLTPRLVQNDQEGAEAILQWLSFVPRDTREFGEEEQSWLRSLNPLQPPKKGQGFHSDIVEKQA